MRNRKRAGKTAAYRILRCLRPCVVRVRLGIVNCVGGEYEKPRRVCSQAARHAPWFSSPIVVMACCVFGPCSRWRPCCCCNCWNCCICCGDSVASICFTVASALDSVTMLSCGVCGHASYGYGLASSTAQRRNVSTGAARHVICKRDAQRSSDVRRTLVQLADRGDGLLRLRALEQLARVLRRRRGRRRARVRVQPRAARRYMSRTDALRCPERAPRVFPRD